MKVSLALRLKSEITQMTDELLKFYKQIGVDNVDLYGTGYNEGGLKKVLKIVKKVRSAELEIPWISGPSINQFIMGQPRGEQQIEEFNTFVKFAGEHKIPLVHLWLAWDIRWPIPGYFDQLHRGGYAIGAFSVELMRQKLKERDLSAPWAHHFKEKLKKDEFMENCVEAYQRIVPVAEDADVKLCTAFSDPPIPDWWGDELNPGINNSTEILRLFDAADSKHVGLHMCIGTRYESGEDIYKQIEVFGRRGEIFHTHFRNVRGTLPINGGYEEVALDDGDMDMYRVLQALDRVGYEGCLNPDHYPKLVGDPKYRASIAFAVGYIKGLLS